MINELTHHTPTTHCQNCLFNMPVSGRFLRIVFVSFLLYLFLILGRIYNTTGSINGLLGELVKSQVQRGVRIALEESFTPSCRRKVKNIPLESTNYTNRPSPPHKNVHIASLLRCPLTPSPHTNHIRLPDIYYNISLTSPGETPDPNVHFFNPTLIPLPYWSASAKYLLISRVVTSGLHQESLVCLANFCLPESTSSSNSTRRHAHPADITTCTASQLQTQQLGPRGGLHCTHLPLKINIPPTPAAQCTGAWTAFPDIPGFHDPRVFWSGKGEPLIIINSASAYGCVGLWLVDLRTLVPQLIDAMRHDGTRDGVVDNSQDDGGQGGPVMSYPHLTELTRNPRGSRSEVEKNWVLWFPNHREAVLGYNIVGHKPHLHSDFGLDLPIQPTNETSSRHDNLTHQFSARILRHRDEPSDQTNRGVSGVGSETGTENGGGRTISLLIGGGLTTPNLTSPSEPPCFSPSDIFDSLNNTGHWHQGSNSLRLILCTRAQARSGQCNRRQGRSSSEDTSAGLQSEEEINEDDDDGRSVHFAILHRKFSNAMDLPLRYERFFVVWECRRPWRMVGVSRFPILLGPERAGGWSEKENWEGVEEEEDKSNPEEKKQSSNRSSAYFTYSPSLAWAWRPKSAEVDVEIDVDVDVDMNARTGILQEPEDEDISHLSSLGTGYLGDEVLVGIGLDDVAQAVARVKVEDLLQCLRLCPGVSVA